MEKFITLVTALLTLSLISERVITWFKLYLGQEGNKLFFMEVDNKAYVKQADDPTNPVREQKITGLNIIICILIALLMNANVFDFLREKNPTEKLGWKNLYSESKAPDSPKSKIAYTKSEAPKKKNCDTLNCKSQTGDLQSPGKKKPGTFYLFFYSIVGCTLTGFCMSLGSTFWHDLLDLLNSIKELRKNKVLQEVKNVTPPKPEETKKGPQGNPEGNSN